MIPAMQYTGSCYDGDIVNGRLEGECEYEFPPIFGTRYIGQMKDGKFHGNGTIQVSDLLWYEGKFENGLSKEGKYEFRDDGLTYVVGKEWKYCNGTTDRLFGFELRDGIKPAGRSMISNIVPPYKIPKGMYDSGEGFYDPVKKVIYSYEMKFLKSADDEEHEWIVTRCRKAEDDEQDDDKLMVDRNKTADDYKTVDNKKAKRKSVRIKK